MRKTGKAAVGGDLRDLAAGIGKQILAVADTYQMDVVRNGIARNALELVGQIVGAHKIFACKILKRQVFGIMRMDEVGNRINPLRNGIFGMFTLIEVVLPDTA